MSVLNQSAKLILFHRGQSPADTCENGAGPHCPTRNQLLRLAVCNESSAGTIFRFFEEQVNHINKCCRLQHHLNSKSDLIAIPHDWLCPSYNGQFNTVFYRQDLLLPEGVAEQWKKSRWLTVPNGRFITNVNYDLLRVPLHNLQADVLAVNVDAELQVGCDKVLITRDNKIVGYRRHYEDAAEQVYAGDDWPHLLFIKTDVLNKVITSNTLCLSFSSFVSKCHSNSLHFRSVKVAGQPLDLDSRQGLLGHLENRANPCEGGAEIDQSARLIGKVFLGRNVTIEQDAVIIGPALLGDNATIARGALIKASIIGPGVCVEREQVIDSQVVINKASGLSRLAERKSSPASTKSGRPTSVFKTGNNGSRARTSRYRIWPRFSYAGCFKRLADIIAATVVLLLFAPVLPIIVLFVKLTSPGPVLFKDKRQGLHGKTFNCMKFRTMVVGADKMQCKLRVVSQVDGPQFKMKNDPRVSRVGQFLRDTYIDEIPQFFNVLIGQMSVVGPRPSPQAENTMCAYWRDARLSIRPGITGLWQVCRTRQEMKDFQEWIYYDTKYVRNMSFRLDMWICWRTFKKIVMNFARRF